MTRRCLPFALLACLASSAAHAGAPSYDLKIDVYNDGKLTHSVLVPIPDSWPSDQLVQYEVGERTPYIAARYTTANRQVGASARAETQQFCSTFFTGISGTITKTPAGLQVSTGLSELVAMDRREDTNGAGRIDMPNVWERSGTYFLRGELADHPATEWGAFGVDSSQASSDLRQLKVTAQVVDRSWWRQLAMSVGLSSTEPTVAKTKRC